MDCSTGLRNDIVRRKEKKSLVMIYRALRFTIRTTGNSSNLLYS